MRHLFFVLLKSIVMLSVFYSLSSNAGKLKSCDDMADFAQKIAGYMEKGNDKKRYLHPNDSRYRISNEIVRYVYSLKNASTPNRIGSMTYTKCTNGTYGTFPRSTPEPKQPALLGD